MTYATAGTFDISPYNSRKVKFNSHAHFDDFGVRDVGAGSCDSAVCDGTVFLLMSYEIMNEEGFLAILVMLLQWGKH